MKLERSVVVAIVALVAIVATASGYYGYEEWLERQPPKVQKGDFVEAYYIGYLENGSIFVSSFEENVTKDTPFNESKYNLTVLKIYIGDGIPKRYPEGWGAGRYSVVKGLWKGLLGMKEGEEKIIGPIPPEDGYGKKVEKNVEFTTSVITKTEEHFIVTNVTDTGMEIKWIPEVGEKFTFMPSFWGMDPNENPHWFWENATEVISFNETHVVVETTPDKTENLTLYPFWENKTKAIVNDTSITLITTPEVGYNFTYFYYIITVENVTEDKINISLTYGNHTEYQEMNRTITFNRSVELPRIINISKEYLLNDFEELGYSFHELAGETLYYRIKVLKIYKMS
ncbi:MAG: FKBP-type peptidyl-prolyl cis-trans isomerase [Thermoplasmata archaeon]|nr:MAG: FKBP-type peptidyl-prolyl cis-trans isomerase [Thermoplasmata archaeon]